MNARSFVELLHHLDDGPVLLVSLSPRRFEVMTTADARELHDQLHAALFTGWVERNDAHHPAQLQLIEGEFCELPGYLQRQAS